ncbi:hypothetical protein [Pseudalkalibacillus hwajinpoensis]|uniref:Uncharacterized protein n=1 Tax=Guptibacillus hwajinpoensis TaxID=208199 RepID=A0A4U1ML13_9BACL|nr:hypothetical protein [Pseudalkalibacillus hwajinpoensis]TKD71306.1 hypothetical protein FBF83_00395 [Pseudalkalibacillus hwajinpoensis]
MTNYIKNNMLTLHVLQTWDMRFIPNYDLFYFEEMKANINCCSRATFTPTIDERTSFLTWNVSPKCKWVAVVSNDTFLALSKEDQIVILQGQLRAKRGFAFTLEELYQLPLAENVHSILDELSFPFDEKSYVIFQKWSWDLLPIAYRFEVLKMIAKDFVESTSISKEGALTKNHSLMNVFIGSNGPNCFSAALCNLEQNEHRKNHLTKKWVQQDEFLEALETYNYSPTKSTNVTSHDVLVWFTENQPVHAAFAINKELLVNKNGQTMFHPYQCLSINNVISEWRASRLVIYKK